LQPSVSIVINNFDYGCFLNEAIDSALAQSSSSAEVIVVDDGSTDNSRELILAYGSRVRPVFKANGGQASAFNAGFAESQGEWILFLDADDRFAPRKAESVLSYAKQFSSAGLVAHALDYCDGENRAVAFAGGISYESFGLIDQRQSARDGRVTVLLPATSALAVRRDVLSQILPMPEDITITADNYIKTAALSLTPVLLSPERLAVQRLHDRNRYTRLVLSEESRLQQYLINAQITFHLRRNFPSLSRLAWKTYGRTLFQLAALKGPRAKEVSKQIRSSYSPFDYSPLCCFYICAAFFKSSLSNRVPAAEIR
jgi:glycosyltransferase involved in cell wall biosynthesis